MAATLKVHKCHTRNVCVRLVKGLHEPYQALPSASRETGTLPSLASIALSHASSMTVEAITTIQTQKKKNGTNRWVLHSLFMYHDHSIRTIVHTI